MYCVLYSLVGISVLLRFADSTCSLPTEWNGNWHDSYRGDIVFNHNTGQVTSGWKVDSYTSSVTSFTCVTEDNGYYLFKGDSFILLFSNNYNAFLCLKYTKLTDYSYYYYIMADNEANANNERAYVSLYDASVTSFPIATYCSPSNDPATEEFHMLVKTGFESNVKQFFPEPLLGNFYYTYNDGSTTTCGANSIWDDCSNRTEAVFNYTQCSTKVLYSTSGTLYCVQYFTSGSTYFVSVINSDASVTNPTTYRFTCMAVTKSGSTVYVSTNPGDCVAGQTSTTRTTNGGLAVLNPYFVCPFTSGSSTSSAGTSIIPIIAAVIGVLLILGILFLACFLFKKHQKNKEAAKVQSHDVEKKPIESNGRAREVSRESDMIVEPMTARDALDISPPGDDEHGLIPLDDAPFPEPPKTPMSQAIRARIPEMQSVQPSLPPISKE